MSSIYRFLVSFVSCTMEIQTCRKNDYFHLGYVNPVVVNSVTLKDNPQETFHNLYKLLSIQHYKQNIVFSLQLSVSVFCRVTLLLFTFV
jgi:hypothetical protein